MGGQEGGMGADRAGPMAKKVIKRNTPSGSISSAMSSAAKTLNFKLVLLGKF